MNGLDPAQLPGQPNPPLLQAALLVAAVQSDIRTLAPQVLREGSTLVSDARVQRWQVALQGALRLIRELPVPLIFPPPAFATFAGAAGDQLDQALRALAALPSAAPLTFPPQFGQAILSQERLQALLGNLQQAQALLIRALQSL